MFNTPAPTARPVPERFLIAISYSGNERCVVEPLAEALEARLGFGLIFYDRWFEHEIAGVDADLRLQELYTARADLVVVGVSGTYGTKSWPLAEFDAIRTLMNAARASSDNSERLRVLPLRVGDGEVPGITTNAVAPDIRGRVLTDTVELVANRLRRIRPDLVLNSSFRAGTSVRNAVFLAETTPDLDDPGNPVSRARVHAVLRNMGWQVLPQSEYESARYDQQLVSDLAHAQAYVQLLGPYPWKRGAFDRRQFDAAERAGIPRFVFRSGEINLDQIEPGAHHALLSRPDIVASSFDDFLRYLETQLGSPRAAPVPRLIDDDKPQPLVRVSVRAVQQDAVWDQVYHWLYEQEQLLFDQLAPGESFDSKQRDDPCQGFLIICDGRAAEDEHYSPREDLVRCRLVQIREKNMSRRPPVALVYWPPPAVSWPRLLRTTPLKLFCVELTVDGKVPFELTEFFHEVRRV